MNNDALTSFIFILEVYTSFTKDGL